MFMILLVLLFQSVLFVGAWYAKDYVSDLLSVSTHTVTSIMNDANLIQLVELLDAQEVQNIVQVGADTGVSVVNHFADSLIGVVNGYMWRRVGWMALVIFFGMTLLYFVGGGNRQRDKSHRTHRNSVRPMRLHVSRNNREHRSRYRCR